MAKILLIGPTTKDIIRIDGKIVAENYGGTAAYAAATLAAIGESCRVLTCCALADRNSLTKHFSLPGVSVDLIFSKQTMQYENAMFSHDANRREQRVLAVSDPFSDLHLGDERYDVLHLGPLLNSDFDLVFVRKCRVLTSILSLDAQGFIRGLSCDVVHLNLWPECRTILALVDIVKFSEEEAVFFAGTSDMRKAALMIAEYGPREVVITLGDRGSLIYSNGEYDETPAAFVTKVVDTTGCGDTFMAAYLAMRLKGKQIAESAQFANQVAAIKVQIMGPIKSL